MIAFNIGMLAWAVWFGLMLVSQAIDRIAFEMKRANDRSEKRG